MDIRQEVISRIKTHFPQAKVYEEDQKQGFEVPCFFVSELEVELEKEVNRRYKETIPLVIQYFTDQPNIKDDCSKVRQILFEIVEELSLNKVRSIKLKGEVVNDVLMVKVSYKRHLIKEKEAVTKMQKLDEEGRLSSNE